MTEKKPTLPTLKRLPLYYNIAKRALNNGETYISSALIANQLNIDPTQVRKDIAAIGYTGKPKVGFDLKEFTGHLRLFLGFDKKREIILIGAGNLGVALARYNGFSPYGLYIQAIFDSNPDKIGQKIEGKEILDIKTVQDYITKNKIKIAILTIPTEHAQKTADTLVKAGITGIWNFAPVNLNLPKGILCKNQDLAASFITFAQLVK